MRAYALAYANWKSFIPKYGDILAKVDFAVEFERDLRVLSALSCVTLMVVLV